MPTTRRQLKARSDKLHASLPADAVAHVLSYIGGPLGRCLVPGAEVCSVDCAAAAAGALSVKALVAPVRARALCVPSDEYETLEEAFSAARDGDTILVAEDLQLDEKIHVPRIRVAVVGTRRSGTFGEGARAVSRGFRPDAVIVHGVWTAGATDAYVDDGGCFWADGASTLTLRNLAFCGNSRDYDSDEEEGDVNIGIADAGVVALNGASVDVSNCWFSHFGRASLLAKAGGRICARDCTLNRSYFGAGACGPGSGLVLKGCLLQGTNMYGAIASGGGRVDVQDCRILNSTQGGLICEHAGSRLRFNPGTNFMPLPGSGAASAVVIESGTLTVPQMKIYDESDHG